MQFSRFQSHLGCRPRLDGARRFALGHAKLLSRASAQQRAGGLAQQRAATTQTPRRPIGAGGVRGASRSGLASVITTHALFARKVHRKLSKGVAGFAAGGSSSDRKRSRLLRRSIMKLLSLSPAWVERSVIAFFRSAVLRRRRNASIILRCATAMGHASALSGNSARGPIDQRGLRQGVLARY
jgi:hypothetical protein